MEDRTRTLEEVSKTGNRNINMEDRNCKLKGLRQEPGNPHFDKNGDCGRKVLCKDVYVRSRINIVGYQVFRIENDRNNCTGNARLHFLLVHNSW